MKILLLDIETSPNTAYVWGIWQENIPLARLIDTSSILCWSAKWFGKKNTIFNSSFHSSHRDMLVHIHSLLDEADQVVTFNGNKFDLKVLNKEFFLLGLAPPSPYKSVDLYQTVKSKFKFVSNKLAHVCEQLGIGKKVETEFSLWVKCMENDPKAWKLMEKYNKNDVTGLLEPLYKRIKPWIKGHANHSVLNGRASCPVCGSTKYHARGYALTAAGRYSRFQCQGCGHWFRSNKTLVSGEKMISL